MGGTGGVLRAQEPALWRPDDRVVLTAFQDVQALARDERRIYAATPGGLAIYDRGAGRWELPSTEEDGYPAGRMPTALAFDAPARLLWLGTADGLLFSYHVDLQRWDVWGSAGVGPVVRIVPASALPAAADRDGLYLLTQGGWYRVGRYAGVVEPVAGDRMPPGLAAEAARAEERLAGVDPFFEAVRGTLTLDAALRRWPITDYVPDDRPNRYWVATRGGLLYYDSRFMRAEPRRFGLLSSGVRALAGDGGRGLWFGGDGRGPRRGVTWGSVDLQEWQDYEAGITGAPAGPVFDIAGSGGGVWFAAADGLYRLDRATERWRRWTEGDGLPAAATYRLEPGPEGGVWVATARGPAFVSAGGEVRGPPPGAQFPTRALLLVGDTLWVGGELGLLWLLGDGSVRAAADSAGTEPSGPVLDLAVTRGSVWALAPDALWRWDGGSWEGPLREVGLAGLGPLVRVRADGERLWVAGAGGIAVRDSVSGAWSYYRVGATIPRGPVTDIYADGDQVYAATPAGVVRIAWTRAR